MKTESQQQEQAEYGAAHDPGRSFGFGLRRVIDGIAIFVGQAAL